MSTLAPEEHTPPTLAELDDACTSAKQHWLSLFERHDWQTDPDTRLTMLRARLAYQDAVAAWLTAGGRHIPDWQTLMAPATS